MFYVNNEFGLAGELIRLNIEDSNYFELLLRFTSDLSQKYRDVDAIAAFNTFQNWWNHGESNPELKLARLVRSQLRHDPKSF